MKKRFFQRVVLVAMAVVTAQVAVAESWRINHDQSTGAHFASINEAMASEKVQDGDMLYLDAGCVLSDNQTISKAVTVIGTGWGFSSLPYLAARLDKALYITVATTVSGLHVVGTVYPQHSDVVIERCYIQGGISQTDSKIVAQNVVIRQCTIDSTVKGAGKTATQTSGWKVYNSQVYSKYGNGAIYNLFEVELVNDILRMNCRTGYYEETTSEAIQAVENAIVKNNIILNITSGGVAFKNIIITDASNLQVYNNVLSADSTWGHLGKYPNNVIVGSATQTKYYVANGDGGEWMRLVENSPAKGAGEGGIDCGPYAEGSLYPFVTYGMPQYVHYPATMVVPARPTDDKVNVNLKIVNQDK